MLSKDCCVETVTSVPADIIAFPHIFYRKSSASSYRSVFYRSVSSQSPRILSSVCCSHLVLGVIIMLKANKLCSFLTLLIDLSISRVTHKLWIKFLQNLFF